MGENKLKIVVNIETGAFVRTPESLAKQLVAAGTHKYSTKGALRNFLNREKTLEVNNRKIVVSEQTKAKGVKTFKDETNGRMYKELPNGQRVVYRYGKS